MKTAKIIITVGSAVGAILFLGAGFVLYRGVVRFNAARDNLEGAKRDLARYYEADPFPSTANVKQELANAEQTDEWFKELMTMLGKGNVTSTERSPSRFIGVLEAASRRLVKEGQKAGTVLPDPPESFAFGFDHYAGTGTLPKPADVPRLMEQLVIINRLCLVLFNHRIKELSEIDRDVFEAAAEAAGESLPAASSRRSSSRRGSSSRYSSQRSSTSKASSPSMAGVLGEKDLYAKMHFALDFRAKESSLLDILNSLTANPMFIVVTSVKLSKKTPELVPVVAEAEDEAAGLAGFGPAPKADMEIQKVGPNYPVCGIKMEIPMDIHLELDVYKFREASVDSGD